MTTFLLIGRGFRSHLLLDVAEQLPGLDCGGVFVRTERPDRYPVFTDLDEAVGRVRPDFAFVTTPVATTASMITALVDRGVPVLAETPPAPDPTGLGELWDAVGASDLVSVAEQYLLMPMHAARRALVGSGVIGSPTQVQVSSTQTYHAISLIRSLLGVGRGPVTVAATRHAAPLLQPLDRGGWTDDDREHPASTTIATLDFGGGRSAVYDFTDAQTRNLLRHRRLLVRGSRGELHDDRVVRLGAPRTLIRETIERRQVGYDVDLNGFDTEVITLGSEVLWRNPYLGQRWMDEEIAVATMLEAVTAWVRGEASPPYPLAEALQDQLIGLAVEQAVAEQRLVTLEPEDWC